MQADTRDDELSVEGTAYFRRIDGILRRMLRVRLPGLDGTSDFAGPVRVRVTMEDESLETTAEAAGGVASLAGPTTYDRPQEVEVAVACDGGAWTARSILPPTRLWTIYIAQDKHLDYGWIHPTEKVVERMNLLLDYHLDAAQRIGLRWNLETAIWVEEYLKARPAEAREKLLAALRSGQFEVGAFYLVPLTAYMGSEELLRGLYFARQLQEELQIPVQTASVQETPSITWGLATLLAGAGVSHVVKGAYDLRNPHLREREPYPLSFWEGPDGSRVLMKWDAYADTHLWGGYAEAYTLWRRSTWEERIRFLEQTMDRYQAYERYPFDAVLLAGTGFDEYPQTTVISDLIRWFNTQGWEYPRLVDATWSQFWQHIEKQIEPAQGPAALVPVVRGDWGASWEEWPAQMAHLNGVYRHARETVLSAQTMAALAYRQDAATHPQRVEALGHAWRGLLQFAEHDFGGINPAMADDTRDRKAAYAYSALREGSRAMEGGLSALASRVSRGDGRHPSEERRLLVANPHSWAHAGMVEALVPEPGPYVVVDVESGQEIPCQVETRGSWPEHYLAFEAPAVPAFGYRTFAVRPGAGSASLAAPAPADPALENAYHRLTLDTERGGLRSWTTRPLAMGESSPGCEREMVQPSALAALNRYLYWSEGQLLQPQPQSVQARHGPVYSELIAESVLAPQGPAPQHWRAKYRLYHQAPYLEIINELTKEPTPEPQCGWFAFPWRMDEPQHYYDAPAAILRPGLQEQGGDLLPGAARACAAVQTFWATSGEGMTVTVATPDAYLFQLGEQATRDPRGDLDPRSSLLLSLALHNLTRNDYMVDQGGQRRFSFRYLLSVAEGPFRPADSLRFARAAAQPLLALWGTGGADAPLPPSQHGFLRLDPEHVLATGFKVAEDGRGWVLRLWEVEGHPAEAAVDAHALGVTHAWRCELLEKIQGPLPVERGVVRVTVPARGMAAVRFDT